MLAEKPNAGPGILISGSSSTTKDQSAMEAIISLQYFVSQIDKHVQEKSKISRIH